MSRIKIISLLRNKSYKLLQAAFFNAQSYKNVIWLVGAPRSGTTWVSNLINCNQSYRFMFEPFHPDRLREMKSFRLYEYIRPDDANHALRLTAKRVFSGKIRGSGVDFQNRGLRHKSLLIKDIFSHLFMAWVHEQFPQVKIIMLIRNPFAVALSKFKTRKWGWLENAKIFLEDKDLCSDYLQPFEGVIKGASDDYIEQQILIWAIIHYVSLKQLGLKKAHILFYEDVVQNPADELARLFRHIDPNADNNDLLRKAMQIYAKPSFVTDEPESVFVKGKAHDWWKKELSDDAMRKGIRILKEFKLDRLYRENANPDRSALDQR